MTKEMPFFLFLPQQTSSLFNVSNKVASKVEARGVSDKMVNNGTFLRWNHKNVDKCSSVQMEV